MLICRTKKKLTTRIMKSFEEDATKVLFEFTAKSVMSPFHTWIEMQLMIKQEWKGKQMMHI